MKKTFFILLTFAITFQSVAQDELTQGNLRFNLSEDGSSFAGMVMLNQLWTRYMWNNPGTLDKRGNALDHNFDIALRRSRVIFYTQLMDKFFMYTMLGYNGQTYAGSKNPGVYIHNAITEYHVDKEKLHIGFGLHTWNGVSRYNNCKLLEFLVVDNPSFAYPTGGRFDQAGRQYGIYAKGTLNQLQYRISLNKPFHFDRSGDMYENTAVEIYNESMSTKGYFTWQFFDKDAMLLPYLPLNSLGKKKMFNIGAGFYYQPESTASLENGQEALHNVLCLGFDSFLDMPLGNGSVLTAYLGYYHYNFGPNYLRAAGKMNVGMGGNLQQGPGISEWETGTGNIIRAELGYKLPKDIGKSQLQPFAALSHKNFEALTESSLQFDIGANLIQFGNHVKWTMQYSTRPLYTGSTLDNSTKLDSYKGILILQTQIFF